MTVLPWVKAIGSWSATGSTTDCSRIRDGSSGRAGISLVSETMVTFSTVPKSDVDADTVDDKPGGSDRVLVSVGFQSNMKMLSWKV